MARFVSLTMAATAVVIGVHSGSPLLALGAICGACSVASLANNLADDHR